MDKSKKTTFKKSILRNVECRKPKTVVKHLPELVNESSTSVPSASIITQTEQQVEAEKPNLETPELYSALKLVNQIQNVENLNVKRVRSVAHLDKRKQIVIDEKAAKLVNFPYNQHIYKDLISLGVKEKPQHVPSISRALVIRDEAPKLSDFFIPKVLPEYSFQVSKQPTVTKPVQVLGDSFKLYRIMQNWSSS